MGRGIMVGLSGRIASGKSYLGEYLEQWYGFQVMRYRTLLARILGERGQPVSRDTLQEIGLELGKEIGYDGLTRLLLEDANPDQNYALDGVRHLSTFSYLKGLYADRFALFYRDVDEALRWRLHNERSAEQIQMTLEEFRAIDRAPVESEIPLLKSKADLIPPFASDPTDLHVRIDAFMFNRFGLTSTGSS